MAKNINMKSPKVTVLMPVYNSEKYLHDAIKSILNQTFRDFEFIIIHDPSTDKTTEILQSFNDPRIKIINNEKVLGLIESLNTGLGIASGEYIARMDSDDISLPERFEKQVKYLQAHPEVGVLGCHVKIVDEISKTVSVCSRPLTNDQNQWRLLFGPSLMHPSVMFRKELIIKHGGYSKEALHAEDYELWSRLSRYTEINQLPDVLVVLRKHTENIGSVYAQAQLETAISITKNNMNRLFSTKVRVNNIDDMVRVLWHQKIEHAYYYNVYCNLFKMYDAFIAVRTLSKQDPRWITKDFVRILSSLPITTQVKGFFYIITRKSHSRNLYLYSQMVKRLSLVLMMKILHR
jgi:glycosyltransferase involved in cell wall biosynthesis